MSDPEEWLSNIARLGGGFNNNRNNNNRAFQPDALLFPCTWPPLHVLNGWAVIRVIRTTLSSSSSDNASSSSSSSSFVVMRSFIIHQAVHGEWRRVFFQEKRVALGVAVHAISFLALVSLIHATFSVDGVAGVLLTPALLASLVSGWMNILLYNERWLAKAAASSATKPNNNNNKRRQQRQRSTTAAKSSSPPQQGKNPFVENDIEATTSWKNEMLQ
jgi:tryptophan-rich sensory protein